jgi:hypothetical protein
VNKEVDKIFASVLKSKLFTNQKKANKRVEKKNKKAKKESAKQAALNAKKTEEGKSRKTPLVPTLVVPVFSLVSNSSTSCPTSLTGLPLLIGPTKQMRVSRLQAGLTSKRAWMPMQFCGEAVVYGQHFMQNSIP